jgi:hypothetical protein
MKIALIGLLLMLAGSAGAVTVTIDGSETNQTIDGFGVNANALSWTNNELQPVLDALIDQAGMTLFLPEYVNCNWETTNCNSAPYVLNWTYYNSVYSGPDFQKLWGMMAYLNQRGITNGLMPKLGGPGPLWMGGLTLNSGHELDYAEMVTSLYIYACQTQQLQFASAYVANEPDNSGTGVQMSSSQYITMMDDVGKLFDTNGMSNVDLSGPDTAYINTNWLSGTNWMTAMMGDPYLMSKVRHFDLHAYVGVSPNAAGVYNFIQQSAYPDRHFWMTEFNVWCPNCNDGVSGNGSWTNAQAIASDLLNHLANGASAGMVWEAYDSQYPNYDASTGMSTSPSWSYWGLLAVDDVNATPKTYTARKQFYTLSQISKFVRPGAQRINVSGSTSSLTVLAFYQAATGQLTLTGVNTNRSATVLSGTLSSLPVMSSLELYYTDSSTNLCDNGAVSVNNNSFTATVPTNCVFTLVGSVVPPYLLTPSALGNNFSFTLMGATGQVYSIEVSTDLLNWTAVTNLTLTNGTTQVNQPMTAVGQFYRASVLP